MSARKLIVVAACGYAGLLMLTGCLSVPWERTGNQGGSSVVQATTKFLGNNLGDLNPDDIQVLADLATSIVGADIPAVTDEQAAAVVSFLDANSIGTVQDLQDIVRQAEQDPNSIVIPDNVRQVIQAMMGSADQYQGLQNTNVEGLRDDLADQFNL